jgi:DNA-binding NtrC family response regulator
LIAEKQFREDLYYRLSMVEIKVPRLADRRDDLSLLERHYLELFSKQYNKIVRTISHRAQAVLSRHSWPGNVRKMENVLGNACMMVEGDTIDVQDLPEYLRERESELEVDLEGAPLPLAEMERRYVCRVLEQMGGNKVQTARVLGISRATLYSILRSPAEEGASADADE